MCLVIDSPGTPSLICVLSQLFHWMGHEILSNWLDVPMLWQETFEDAVREQEHEPDAILTHMSERKPLPPGDPK